MVSGAVSLTECNLEEVRIFKYDTCYTYALKRIGVFNRFLSVESDEFVRIFSKHKIEDLDCGDLIVFDKNCVESATVLIDKTGKTITKKVNFGLHFLVFEREFVSYLSTRNNRGNIKLRLYKEIFDEQINVTANGVKIFVIKNHEILEYREK